MTIEFPCPECQQLVRTPDAAAGKKGKCPSCSAVVRIPEATAAAAPSPAPAAVKRPSPAATPAPASAQPPTKTAPAEDTGPIEFFCSSCGQVVRTPRAAAGKKGKCPHCAEIIMIPLGNKPKPVAAKSAALVQTAEPAKPAPTAKSSEPKPQPKPARPAQPAPAPAPMQEEIGLASLDDLAPLPEQAPQPKPAGKPAAPPPLTPLAPLAPLAPLGNDPFGTQPAGGVAMGNFFGAGAPAPDPFGGLAPLGTPNTDPFGGTPLGIPPASAFGGASSGHSLPPAPISSYQQPAMGYSDPGAALVLPAIFQLIVSIPVAGATIAGTLMVLLGIFLGMAMAADLGAQVNQGALMIRIVWIIGGVIAAIVQLVVIFGSIKQLQRREYDQVMTANWLSLIPCFLPFSFPFGIWSLILLHQDPIRRSFRR